MATSDNILTQVITYNESNLAYLQNLNAFIHTANKKFKDFNNIEANLGSTVSFDLPPRFTVTSGLVATFQPAVQRIQNLVCDNAYNTSYAFSAQQFIFNVEDYMMKFGKSAIEEIGARIEANVALNCETQPYRFYGDGITDINSYQNLAEALALFRTYGSAKGRAKAYLDDTSVPSIVASGLTQFALDRNKELAMSWEVGAFSNCDFYQSNLLPLHISGSQGNTIGAGNLLTVVSFTRDANNAINTITFSGTAVASDPTCVLQYDRFVFADGVTGLPNIRFRTFVGHEVSAAPVQFMATADATSTGGNEVTVSISPPLQASAGSTQNLSSDVQVGMQVNVLPTHRVGLITSGDPLFIAMPRLPEEVPFPTSAITDQDTGVSLRQYYGSLFGQNQQGMVHDAIWGSTLVPEYSLALIFTP